MICGKCRHQPRLGSIKGEVNTLLQTKFCLPSSEILLAKFRCALQNHTLSLSQGRLYVFPRHIAFACKIPGQSRSILIRLLDVSNVRKAKTLYFLPNAIEIRLIDGTTYFLTSFLSRNEAYHLMYDLWLVSHDMSSFKSDKSSPKSVKKSDSSPTSENRCRSHCYRVSHYLFPDFRNVSNIFPSELLSMSQKSGNR